MNAYLSSVRYRCIPSWYDSFLGLTSTGSGLFVASECCSGVVLERPAQLELIDKIGGVAMRIIEP